MPNNATIYVNTFDRMRLALELIASIRVEREDGKALSLAINTAKAALANDDHDPLCEVLK